MAAGLKLGKGARFAFFLKGLFHDFRCLVALYFNVILLTADCKLTRAFCACERGIHCLYEQLSIVYICHSKGETETKIYKINADIQNVNKTALAYHFEYQ